jgi:hypothetical protein
MNPCYLAPFQFQITPGLMQPRANLVDCITEARSVAFPPIRCARRPTAINASYPVAIPVAEHIVRLKIRKKADGLDGFDVAAMKNQSDLSLAQQCDSGLDARSSIMGVADYSDAHRVSLRIGTVGAVSDKTPERLGRLWGRTHKLTRGGRW